MQVSRTYGSNVSELYGLLRFKKTENTAESIETTDKNPQDPNKINKNLAQQEELSSADKMLIAKLQARDAQVRAHEAAHIAAGAGVVSGGASFTYQIGPDGKQYAVGGEVPISYKEGSTPEETIEIAQKVRAAALAPIDPSPQDLKVAAAASMLELKARAQKDKERLEELKANNPEYKKQAAKAYESA